MKPESFEPSEYTSPCGTIRVRREGSVWRAEVLEDVQAEHDPHAPRPPRWRCYCHGTTAQHAIADVLDALGLVEPEPDDAIWWPAPDDDCGF